VLRHIRDWRERMDALKSDLERIEAAAGGSGPEDFHPSLTRAYGLEYARALIRWTKIAERRIAEGTVASR
jgi:hypothetical protein